MIKSIYYPRGGSPQKDLGVEAIHQAIEANNGCLWVSLEHPTNEEIHLVLGDIFHFHPLAIEDSTTNGYQTPKIDDFSSYLFILCHALKPGPELDTMELNAFLGKNYLVTSYISGEMPPIKAVWDRLDRDERLVKHGPDFLLHAILDFMVDEYMPVLDQMDEEIELLEDQVLDRPQPPVLERILALKHRIMGMRRIISPQREVMNRLSRDDFPQIDRQSRIYYRDIYDHLVRIQDLTENIRDIVSGSLDIYLSATSNRLNQIMKALTIVSTIFLPMSVIVGLYGMNFKYIPELNWKFGYPMVWIILITIGLGQLVYFRKKGWF